MVLFISSYTIINIFDYAVFYDILLYDKTRILSWFFVKKKKKNPSPLVSMSTYQFLQWPLRH